VTSRLDYEPAAIARAEAMVGRRRFELDRRRLNAEDLLREVNPAEREILDTLAPERRQRLKGAAYLLRQTALSLPLDDERRRNFLYVAAELFENLGGVAAELDDRRLAFQALSQAATCWSLAGYQANAVVMGQRLRRRFREFDVLAPATEVGAPGPLDFYAVAAGVLERDLHRLEHLVVLRESFLRDVEGATLASADNGLAPTDLVELLALGELLAGVTDALKFWRSGDESAARRATAHLAEAEHLTLAAETPETWLITNSAREIFSESMKVSTWRTFRRYAREWTPLWRRYLRSLANQSRPPVVELWPSQRLALEAGLLDERRPAMAVRTPTSSGKTRMAEAAIVEAISRDPGTGCCVYVVPFRALATEVEATLGATLGALGLRVSSLFGGYESSDLEDFLLSSSDVLVLTPEKLDLVLRADEEFRGRVRLVVMDEGQLLGDENSRAVRTEMLLVRLRRAAPDARVLFLSAVVPNIEQIARWLKAGDGGALTQPWRPTRLLTGVFRWRGNRGRIDYEGQAEFFVPYVLTQEERSLGLTPKRKQPTKPKPWPGNVAETAAELALHFQALGPVVVFSAQPRTCASVCSALATGLWLREQDGGSETVVPEGRERDADELAAFAARLLGADHELVGWLQLGVAYHHARVPEALRIRIEDAFREGVLQVIVCTTTLSQGVNLPVKTLIVSHTLRGHNDPVPVRDFWNIAGRAGRANRETRGQIILIESPTSSEARRQRAYLDQDNIEPLRSRLLELLAWLAHVRCPTVTLTQFEDVVRVGDEDELDPDIDELVDDEDVGEDVVELEAQVLALLVEEVIDTDDLDLAEALLGESLAGVQLLDLGGTIRPFARFLAARASRVTEVVPEPTRRALYYRTGLSVASCVTLDAAVDELFDRFGEHLLAEDTRPELRTHLLQAAMSITETAPTEGVAVDLAVEVALDWIAYTSMEELRGRYGGRHDALSDPTRLNLFVQDTLVRGAPWAVSATLLLLRARLPEGEELPENLRALPALVKFGVDSPQAAYASTMAAEDRETARKLAEAAAAADVPSGFRPFLAWLSELLVDDLHRIVGEGRETLRLARRVARLAASDLPLELLFGRDSVAADVRGLIYEDRAAALSGLTVGDAVALEREPDNPYDPNAIRVRRDDGRDLGYVAREAARGIAGRLDDGEGVSARVTDVDAVRPSLRLLLALH
jgi:hypothetical protein